MYMTLVGPLIQYNMIPYNPQIYGGGHMISNTQLNITSSHLFAVYSGGRLNLDETGWEPVADGTYQDNQGSGQGRGETLVY